MLLVLIAAALLGVVRCEASPSEQTSDSAAAPRTRTCFDARWRFALGDPSKAENPSFDDSGWRLLDLPHDWSIEGKFDADNPSAARGAYLPAGIGWYRKSFRLPPEAEGRRVFIEFDGVYMNGEVWINGHRLGKRPYGFVSFGYDLTPHLDFKGDNVLAVRVDNALQPSSRWYTGSGIYRHVWLTVTDRLHVGHWGTQVSTPEVSEESARVAIRTTVRNGHAAARDVDVRQVIVAPNGQEVVSTAKAISVRPDKEQIAEQELTITEPLFWSPQSPHLYTLRTELHVDGRLVDRYHTPLGIRSFHFDPDRGLIFNGEPMIMKGMCNHHDLGPLGAALWDDALERRLRMLKQMGCNAIRTAHNPPSPELLEMCDRLGFLVIDETFDEWRRGWAYEDGRLVAGKENRGKARYGYHLYFDEWAKRDLTDHIRRDRNHPSVIMWSVGNEVPEAQRHGELETLKWLRDLCHRLDPTRPMSVGCNFIAGANETGFPEHMDVVGYNGGGGSCFQYEADHAEYPERRFYASEVPHTFQTRGEYRTHSRYREPKHQPPNITEEEVFPETDGWYESSYDNAGVRICARDSWRLTKTLPFVAGEFRWTGFDYLGESGGWPRVIGNFGIIDLCNFPKDTYYFYQSQWTDEPMVHLLPHWNWPGKEGIAIPVWAYTNCDRVELFLNGKSLGEREFTEERDMHLEWLVPYQPGELKAVAHRDGKEVATFVTRTAAAPAAITLSTDRPSIRRGSRELSFVTIRVEDADGNFVPTADRWVKLSISGPGRIVAVGSGDPMSHESFRGRSVCTFNGLALVMIASDAEAVARFERWRESVADRNKPIDPNRILLKTYSKGLAPAELEIDAAQGSARHDALDGGLLQPGSEN